MEVLQVAIFTCVFLTVSFKVLLKFVWDCRYEERRMHMYHLVPRVCSLLSRALSSFANEYWDHA